MNRSTRVTIRPNTASNSGWIVTSGVRPYGYHHSARTWERAQLLKAKIKAGESRMGLMLFERDNPEPTTSNRELAFAFAALDHHDPRTIKWYVNLRYIDATPDYTP